MDERKLCAICNKWFANGKALGGHMRAHFAKFPLPPKPDPDPDPPPQPPPPVPVLAPVMPQPELPGADPNQSRVLRARNKAFSFSESVAYDIDSESESESRKHVTRRRSKRGRRAKAAADPEPDRTGCVLSEENGAISLMMLSRDSWSRKGGEAQVVAVEQEELYESANDVAVVVEGETCKKPFGSSDAQRASPNVSRTDGADVAAGESNINLVDVVIEMANWSCGCPFCNKLFGSSRALAGHKKVHASSHVVANSSGAEYENCSRNMIDLNSLPLPEEGDDGDDMSG